MCESTLTRACKPMCRSDSTFLVTPLDQAMTRLWLDSKKNVEDFDSKGVWLWLGKSDSSTSLLSINTRSPGQVVQSSASNIIGNTQSLHAWRSEITIYLWCIGYMDVQEERKSTFLTAFEHWKKKARSLFAAQYWYRSCPECLCHLRAQYPVEFPDICSGWQILHFDHPFYILTTHCQW